MPTFDARRFSSRTEDLVARFNKNAAEATTAAARPSLPPRGPFPLLRQRQTSFDGGNRENGDDSVRPARSNPRRKSGKT